MDCLARAFSEFTKTDFGVFVRELTPIKGAGTYHIQDIIALLADHWHITEFFYDSPAMPDSTNPHKRPEYIHNLMSKYKGVVAYQTREGHAHAIPWYGGDIPDVPLFLFWRVEPRE